jgi:hypothetical protein
VALTVAGEEGDPPSIYGADGQRGRRRSVRRVDLDRLGVGEELVEPRSAEDPDLGRRGVAHDVELLLALAALSDELVVDEAEELDEPDVLPDSEDEPGEEPLSELDEEPPEDDADEPFFDPRLSVL